MPLCAIVQHSPRQLALLREAHFRRQARARIERLHDTQAAVAACWAKDGPRHFQELEQRLKDIALSE